ncbi:MAG TPA: acetyl-CoA carboxylase biotin carboxylase subunit [Planctomycetota bacterium]|nr:acetyl-CoA carboxylase biotin carboxylase subunit [Planctomycetota bacterium]
MFSRILIAARGEIALRIIRACKELGIETVVVYSEADRDCIYRRFADDTICIGPSYSAESYLNIPSIIAAAEIADVDAIHPGYGFLSEHSHFAEVCESSNIVFIGPSPKAMQLMGNKSCARDVAKGCGVPIVPGSDGELTQDEDALRLAHEIGYPIIIKASAGGGGRGMRIARNDISLINAINVARNEAQAAFSDSSIYMEKLITEARHVEVQVLGDHYGHTIALGERDCSLQRRHQKLIEESPCPSITDDTRNAISAAAVKIAKAAGYYGAGTVEFLVDKNNNFYFIEMNCRIQVEHPVTEMVTGIDIIKQQLRIASGHKLRIKQEDVRNEGVAIECRINAEDPKNNFKPSPGKVTFFYPPGGPGVRIDSHLYSGCVVSSAYDSLVAKLIVHRANRREAVACMKRALEEFIIEGIKTTIPLYLEIFGHSAFLSGKVDTNFVETEFSD